MSKIVVLLGSPRKNGNTDLLVRRFVEGASLHHEVEVVSVTDYEVRPCRGCDSCFGKAEHPCCQKDDMGRIYEKLSSADVLVVASPVYFYGISSQLKAVIDRLHNPLRDTFHIRRMALLLVGAATLPELFDAILAQYRLCLKFFGMEDAGKVLVRGVRGKGDISQRTDALDEAYALGAGL